MSSKSELRRLGVQKGGKSPNKVLAIDPGPEYSAYVAWTGETIISHGIEPNHSLIELLKDWPLKREKVLVIEQVVCLGMPVGADVFETVFWSGRFWEAWNWVVARLSRKDVKMHLCNSMRAKDLNVITSLVDRFDPLRQFGKYGKGTKKNPGFFFGFHDDLWQAFALAVTFHDQHIGNHKK